MIGWGVGRGGYGSCSFEDGVRLMDLKRIKKYILVSQAHEIALRVFVMNSFDGILAIMGVVIGAHLSGVSDPRVVITAGVGGSVALGISGISSAYIAESAARKMEQRKLEGAMLKSLDDTQLSRASRFAAVLVALVNGISPTLGGMILLLPYVLAPSATVLDPFYASLALAFILLFVMGAYLGKISEGQIILSGLKMILVGIVTMVAVNLLAGPSAL
ncbi:VIT1/CCC1 transporter family protein [Methanocrinis sp.]|uniref:VIT1/CCC1 transporter family protein n=1 Tax=Methanocrinis sp. TaxID=3101522 RepID=UPI003D0C0FF9